MIVRAILAMAFAWLVMPRPPDLGPAPNINASAASFAAPDCATSQIENCAERGSPGGIGASGPLERLRGTLLDGIAIVRADLKAHGSHGG